LASLLGLLALTAAVASFLYVRRDPLRLSMSERRAYERAKTWRSDQPWGPSTGQERRLVSAAVQAVARIVSCHSWTTPALDEHRLRLDLVAELREIDQRAYALTGL